MNESVERQPPAAAAATTAMMMTFYDGYCVQMCIFVQCFLKMSTSSDVNAKFVCALYSYTAQHTIIIIININRHSAKPLNQ